MAMEQNKWNDISSEAWREYVYVEGDMVSKLRIEGPVKLNVSPSSMGGHAHRIVTATGHGIYVAPGWRSIEWEPKPGAPNFTF
jgi:hypothetical protein